MKDHGYRDSARRRQRDVQVSLASAAVALAAVLLVAGCGTAPARGQSTARTPGASSAPAAPGRPAAPGSDTPAVWLYSLQMTSATTGWAQNPAVADDGHLAPARTTDGARSRTSVTPPTARALLAAPGAAAVLEELDGQRAWLAVTAATTGSSPVRLTEVFGTSNGGRAWTESGPLKVSGHAKFLSFTGPARGWLLMSDAAAMGRV